jgi:uncharacterized protein (TIGR03435 family)
MELIKHPKRITAMTTRRLSVLLVAAACTSTLAQSPQFEVASVKPNTSGTGFINMSVQPGGRYTAINVPLRLLILNAYRVQENQLVGAPDWATNERFDITAKADGDIRPPVPGGPPSPVQFMLQALLEDRFKLAVHRETRDMPIYALTLARADGKLGPQLKPSTTDCAALVAARGGRGGPPPPGLPPPGERPMCGTRMMPGNISGGSMTLQQLTTTLAMLTRRVVIDKTGLAGGFDIDLTFTPDQMPGPPPPGAPPLPAIDPNGPSIFTAVQEQLGLKLEASRGPAEVLVIDHVERPTPD